MDILLKHLESQGPCLIQSIDRHGDDICELVKGFRKGDWYFDVKYSASQLRRHVSQTIYIDRYMNAEDAARAFVYHSRKQALALRVVASKAGKSNDLYTLYKHDFSNKYHCMKACLSSTPTPQKHKVQMHTLFQLLQDGAICKDCYDCADKGLSLKSLYDIHQGLKQWSELSPAELYSYTRKSDACTDIRLMGALIDHFKDHDGSLIRAIDKNGQSICELIETGKVYNVYDDGEIRWYTDCGSGIIEYPTIDDAIDAFIKECKSKYKCIISLDEKVPCTLYKFESDKRFHYSKECDVVTHKASYILNEVPMHTAFCLLKEDMICGSCYGGRLKCLRELWEKVEPSIRP